MKTISKLSSIRAMFRAGNIGGFDMVSAKKTGDIVFRKGYFYRNGMDADKFAAQVGASLKAASIDFDVVTFGDHYAAFKGSASTANQSHFYFVIK